MGWVVNATPRPLYLRERPDTHCIGDWVGPRAGLDGCGIFRPPPGFDPWTVAIPTALPGTPYVYMYVCKYLWNTERYHTG